MTEQGFYLRNEYSFKARISIEQVDGVKAIGTSSNGQLMVEGEQVELFFECHCKGDQYYYRCSRVNGVHSNDKAFLCVDGNDHLGLYATPANEEPLLWFFNQDKGGRVVKASGAHQGVTLHAVGGKHLVVQQGWCKLAADGQAAALTVNVTVFGLLRVRPTLRGIGNIGRLPGGGPTPGAFGDDD